jgi:hypothetical protein
VNRAHYPMWFLRYVADAWSTPHMSIMCGEVMGYGVTNYHDLNVAWWKPGPLPPWFPWQPKPIWRHHA